MEGTRTAPRNDAWHRASPQLGACDTGGGHAVDEWAGDAGSETERLLARVSRRLTPREASLFLAHARGASETELASSHGYSSAGRVRFRLNRIRWHIAESFPDDAEVAALLSRRVAG